MRAFSDMGVRHEPGKRPLVHLELPPTEVLLSHIALSGLLDHSVSRNAEAEMTGFWVHLPIVLRGFRR